MPSSSLLSACLAAFAVVFNPALVDARSTPRRGGSSGCPSGTSPLLSVGFDNHSRGRYSASELNDDFPGTSANNNKYKLAELVDDGNGGNALRHRHRDGCAGGNCGLWFLTKLKEEVDIVYYSFRLRFSGKNFDFAKGGKLPGVCGGSCNAGHRVPNGHDGWSVREMWGGKGGRAWLENYVYHIGQPEKRGQSYVWSNEVRPNNWYNLRVKVEMNTAGKADGSMEAWLDGDSVLSKSGIKFRSTSSLKVEYFVFANFYGGEDRSWAPDGDQFMDFDDFLVCG